MQDKTFSMPYGSIDPGIVNEIRMLNELGIETYFSCADHRKGTMVRRFALSIDKPRTLIHHRLTECDCPYLVFKFQHDFVYCLAELIEWNKHFNHYHLIVDKHPNKKELRVCLQPQDLEECIFNQSFACKCIDEFPLLLRYACHKYKKQL